MDSPGAPAITGKDTSGSRLGFHRFFSFWEPMSICFRHCGPTIGLRRCLFASCMNLALWALHRKGLVWEALPKPTFHRSLNSDGFSADCFVISGRLGNDVSELLPWRQAWKLCVFQCHLEDPDWHHTIRGHGNLEVEHSLWIQRLLRLCSHP